MSIMTVCSGTSKGYQEKKPESLANSRLEYQSDANLNAYSQLSLPTVALYADISSETFASVSTSFPFPFLGIVLSLQLSPAPPSPADRHLSPVLHQTNFVLVLVHGLIHGPFFLAGLGALTETTKSS